MSLVRYESDPDTLADDPSAYAAYMDLWQRSVDRGEFCPTCGRGVETIAHAWVGPVPLWQCRACGDEWPDQAAAYITREAA